MIAVALELFLLLLLWAHLQGYLNPLAAKLKFLQGFCPMLWKTEKVLYIIIFIINNISAGEGGSPKELCIRPCFWRLAHPKPSFTQVYTQVYKPSFSTLAFVLRSDIVMANIPVAINGIRGADKFHLLELGEAQTHREPPPPAENLRGLSPRC